ncbi:MAG: prepilin-type N-terminal cleavage/methylation domain-containing protein [Planctomycetota bacterium]
MRKKEGPDMRKYRAQCAFTLIELLVVIAIIALLLAIILPALKSAKMLAKRLVSSSNMRQIGVAFFMYAENNKGFFPETTHGLTGAEAEKRSWIYTLGSYIDNVDKVRICPADPKRKERLENKVSSYIMNEYIAVDQVDPFGRGIGPSYRNMNRLKSASRTITTFVGADDLSSSITSDHTHSRLWFSPSPNVPWDTLRDDIQVDRYKNGTLFLYADSHVDPIKQKKIKEMADNFENFAEP